MDTTYGSRASDISQPIEQLHDNEQLKARSRYLRGDIARGLTDPLTGAVPGDDPLLMKFHGIYQQDDRDLRAGRVQRKLEPNYQFMVRLRIPGGLLTPKQWLQLDNIARTYAERGLRITTRQTVQLHGVRKRHLRATLQAICASGLDTIAACGDDSRGVVCGADPARSAIHAQVTALAAATSARLIPRTHAYREIWQEAAPTAVPNEEPIYGELYLPRKFKVGFVIPPINDIDVYGQDLGLIAIVEHGRLIGFNVCVGGGMGKLDNREDSYPRLAESIGFIEAEQVPAFAETVMTIQRDYGDRKDRHRARFKYTLDRLGTAWFLEQLQSRRGQPLHPSRPVRFTQNGDQFGWQQGDDGRWSTTIYVESGRIDGALQDQIKGFVESYGGAIRLTTNQNFQLTGVGQYEQEQAKWRLRDLGLEPRLQPNNQAAHTLSCVALPTCGLAMAEAERYTPHFLKVFNQLKANHGLEHQPITLRLSGCPNGCARPYLAEIALTGRAPGLYNLYLGGSFHGDRLAQHYASNLGEEKILAVLDQLFSRYAAQRQPDEHFGDFLVRMRLLGNTTV